MRLQSIMGHVFHNSLNLYFFLLKYKSSLLFLLSVLLLPLLALLRFLLKLTNLLIKLMMRWALFLVAATLGDHLSATTSSRQSFQRCSRKSATRKSSSLGKNATIKSTTSFMTFKMVQLQKVITSTNLVNPFQQYSQKQYLLHQEETAGLREQLRNETKRSVKRGAQLIIQSNLSIATQAQEITPKLLPLRRKSAHDILFRQSFCSLRGIKVVYGIRDYAPAKYVMHFDNEK
ncbi:hypothetical protein AB4K20DRAFT_1986743 [Rhizopus microsporus]|uniref:Uncharacterized protein n=1 Tax=Rhizopus microsporus TaxID=58291 RepID=A0A1X0SA45_RHIZD|nr:hypothetical protein BCV71DRAFT_277555 [Rhizopus microsporus]